MTSKVPSHPNNSIIFTMFPKSVPNSADPTDLQNDSSLPSSPNVPPPPVLLSSPGAPGEAPSQPRYLQAANPTEGTAAGPGPGGGGRPPEGAAAAEKPHPQQQRHVRRSHSPEAQRPFRRAGPEPRRGRSAGTSTAASARPEVAGEGRAAILDAGARCQASRWRRRRAGSAGKGRAVTTVTGARPGLRARPRSPWAGPSRRSSGGLCAAGELQAGAGPVTAPGADDSPPARPSPGSPAWPGPKLFRQENKRLGGARGSLQG